MYIEGSQVINLIKYCFLFLMINIVSASTANTMSDKMSHSFAFEPGRAKTCLRGLANNKGADTQSDQSLCHSLIRKYHI